MIEQTITRLNREGTINSSRLFEVIQSRIIPLTKALDHAREDAGFKDWGIAEKGLRRAYKELAWMKASAIGYDNLPAHYDLIIEAYEEIVDNTREELRTMRNKPYSTDYHLAAEGAVA